MLKPENNILYLHFEPKDINKILKNNVYRKSTQDNIDSHQIDSSVTKNPNTKNEVKDFYIANKQIPIIESVKLEFVRLDPQSKIVQSVKIPVISEIAQDNAVKTDFQTQAFQLPLEGFYQARFTINLIFPVAEDTKESDSQEHNIRTVFFYHWVFNTLPASKES